MKIQEYSRRHFMEAVGAAALSSIIDFRAYAEDEKKQKENKDDEEKERKNKEDREKEKKDKDEKHKDRRDKDDEPVIIEILPQEATFVNLGTKSKIHPYKSKHEKIRILNPHHEHSQELEEILSNNQDSEQISHEENSGRTARRVYDKYGKNIATLIGFNKKRNMFVPQVGLFLSPSLILTTYSNAQERIGGDIAESSYVQFSEKNPHRLSEPLEVVALDPEKGLALLHMDEPNEQIEKIQIARTNPKPKQKLYGIYRDFPAKNEEKTILVTGGKISPTTLIPSTPPNALSMSRRGLNLANGYRHCICIGYSVSIPDEITPENLREMDIEKLSSACIRRHMRVVGSPVFNKNQFVGLITMALLDGNIDYITSPASAREFLEDYKSELKKK